MNRHLGSYDRDSDRTYKPNNSLVGEGNQLVALIYEDRFNARNLRRENQRGTSPYMAGLPSKAAQMPNSEASQ